MSRRETSKRKCRGRPRRKCKVGWRRNAAAVAAAAAAASGGCILHWIKQQTFLTALAYISGELQVWQGHYVPIQKKQKTNKGPRTDRRRKKEKDKKREEKKTSVLLFVFSLVYLVWGSLVYNIYHHVFQNYLLRNWLYGKVKKKQQRRKWKKKIKVISLDLKPHKANDMPCRPSFIGSSFWFLKTGSGSTMYIFMQVFKKFITVCLAITTLFTLWYKTWKAERIFSVILKWMFVKLHFFIALNAIKIILTFI